MARVVPAEGRPGPFVQVYNDVAVSRKDPTQVDGDITVRNLVAETAYELSAYLDTGLGVTAIPGMTASVESGTTVVTITSGPLDRSGVWVAALRAQGIGIRVGTPENEGFAVLGDNAATQLLAGQQLVLEHAYTGPQAVAGEVYLATPRSAPVLFTTANRGKPAVAPAPLLSAVSGGSFKADLSGPLDTGGVALESFTLRLVTATAAHDAALTAHFARNPALVATAVVDADTGYTTVVVKGITAVHHTSRAVDVGVFIGEYTGSYDMYDLPANTTFDVSVEPVSQVSLCLADADEIVLRPAARNTTTRAVEPNPVDNLR